MFYSIKYQPQGEECVRHLVSKLKCLRTDENRDTINYIIYLYCTLLVTQDTEIRLHKINEIGDEIQKLNITATLKYQLLHTVVYHGLTYINDMPNLYDIVKESCM